MGHHLRLDRSRLLGFKLTALAAFDVPPCDPRLGAKVGGPKIDSRIGAKIGPKIDPRIGAKIGDVKRCDPRLGAKIGPKVSR